MKAHFPIDPERNKFAVGKYPVENKTLLPSDPASEFQYQNRCGKPVLQHCQDCQTVQYPSREVCRNCLSTRLQWRPIASDLATVVSCTQLMHSLESRYRDRTPWYVLSVRLNIEHCPATVLVHAVKPFMVAQTVRLSVVQDERYQSMFFACKLNQDPQKIWRKLGKEKIFMMSKRDRNNIHE